MRKLFLRLSIAFLTFSFGLVLTWMFVSPRRTSAALPIQTVEIAPLENTDEQILREIYREYGPAQTKHDRAFFERVESERFILFDWDRNLTREQDIREMESWPRDTVYECEVESIELIDQGAVVTMRMHARSDGKVDSYRSVDVWIKKEASWQILSTTALE